MIAAEAAKSIERLPPSAVVRRPRLLARSMTAMSKRASSPLKRRLPTNPSSNALAGGAAGHRSGRYRAVALTGQFRSSPRRPLVNTREMCVQDVESRGVHAVTGHRSMRIAVSLARQVAQSPNSRWCAACVDLVGATGAGLTLMGRAGGLPLCASNDDVAALEEMACATGAGPCHDAHQARRQVHATRLDDVAWGRWPGLAIEARSRGIVGRVRLSVVRRPCQLRRAHDLPGRRGRSE